MAPSLSTIGHSTRPIEEFIELCQAHDIQLLGDVRMLPYSRRNPQFNTDALAESLAAGGLRYTHLPALGGRRKSRPDSVNLGWRNVGFRGYADYMQTEPFWRGLDELIRAAENSPTAIICAEAVPWRCHRSLIADALVSRGWQVRHIITPTNSDAHHVTPFALLKDGLLFYPKPAASDSTPSLF